MELQLKVLCTSGGQGTKPYFRSALCKLECASESPRSCVKTWIPGFNPRVSGSVVLGWDMKICISSKLPGDTYVAGPQPILEDCLRPAVLHPGYISESPGIFNTSSHGPHPHPSGINLWGWSPDICILSVSADCDACWELRSPGSSKRKLKHWNASWVSETGKSFEEVGTRVPWHLASWAPRKPV